MCSPNMYSFTRNFELDNKFGKACLFIKPIPISRKSPNRYLSNKVSRLLSRILHINYSVFYINLFFLFKRIKLANWQVLRPV